MEQTISDRERLVGHLEKCIAAKKSVLLNPGLPRIALKALREYSPSGKSE